MLTTKSLFLICQGFVISDWQGIDKITTPPDSNYSYSVQASIEAGIDMVSLYFLLKLHVRFRGVEFLHGYTTQCFLSWVFITGNGPIQIHGIHSRSYTRG